MAHFYLHVHGTPLMINGVYVCGLVKDSEIPVPVQTVKHRPLTWIISAELLQKKIPLKPYNTQSAFEGEWY